MAEKKRPHTATHAGGQIQDLAYSCVCDLDADHAMGPLSKEQMEGYAGAMGCEVVNVFDTPWAYRNGPEQPWVCGRPRAQIKIEGLPPKWSETPEDVRRAADALTSFTHAAYRVQVAQREEDLKTAIRRAIELVEQNPRNEPMRTEISRPAVERMLAEDLGRLQLGRSAFTDAGRAELATELFDLGWRPTIDRLVR